MKIKANCTLTHCLSCMREINLFLLVKIKSWATMVIDCNNILNCIKTFLQIRHNIILFFLTMLEYNYKVTGRLTLRWRLTVECAGVGVVQSLGRGHSICIGGTLGYVE